MRGRWALTLWVKGIASFSEWKNTTHKCWLIMWTRSGDPFPFLSMLMPAGLTKGLLLPLSPVWVLLWQSDSEIFNHLWYTTTQSSYVFFEKTSLHDEMMLYESLTSIIASCLAKWRHLPVNLNRLNTDNIVFHHLQMDYIIEENKTLLPKNKNPTPML